MTQRRPGGGDPYRDPYGQDDVHRAERHGADPYGTDPYGVSGAPYGEDPYGTRQPGGGDRGAAGYGGEAYGGGAYGDDAGYDGGRGYGPAQEQSAWNPDPYAYPYEHARDDYRAAVDSLSDPLTDPLPSSEREGPRVPSWAPQVTRAPEGAVGPQGGPPAAEQTSPWFQPAQHAQDPSHPHRPQAPQTQTQRPQAPQQPQQHQGHQGQPHQPQAHQGQAGQQASYRPRPAPRQAAPEPRRGPADVGATAALPAVETPEPATREDGAGGREGATADREDRTVALRRPSEAELGGRAARRRAASAQGRGGRRAAPATPARPMTRLEARRAARAAKDGPVVLLSRAIGEVFITCGVLMLLFVAYQLWWTNVLAGNYAGGAKDSLTQRWESNPERKPGKFSPGQGFAIMYIPKLDVVVPVAQGIDKESVLDNGLVGHYDEKSGLKTAMPWDEKGNFGVAGHRNTHGEPFRYINRLVAGDEIIVETADTYYVYEMYSRLPSTLPSDVSVLESVPGKSGFEKPGRYITLTTCTPEFTSKYRLIVWGRMVDERPRSEGKPDALVE